MGWADDPGQRLVPPHVLLAFHDQDGSRLQTHSKNREANIKKAQRRLTRTLSATGESIISSKQLYEHLSSGIVLQRLENMRQ